MLQKTERLYVMSVPHGLEHCVCEAHDGEILNHLLPEIVVDAIDLLLLQQLAELGLQRVGAAGTAIRPNFSDQKARLWKRFGHGK